jgi:hypothetical protein
MDPNPYKDKVITIGLRQDQDGNWYAFATIRDAVLNTVGSIADSRKFPTEQEAINAAKKMAQHRVDHE